MTFIDRVKVLPEDGFVQIHGRYQAGRNVSTPNSLQQY